MPSKQRAAKCLADIDSLVRDVFKDDPEIIDDLSRTLAIIRKRENISDKLFEKFMADFRRRAQRTKSEKSLTAAYLRKNADDLLATTGDDRAISLDVLSDTIEPSPHTIAEIILGRKLRPIQGRSPLYPAIQARRAAMYAEVADALKLVHRFKYGIWITETPRAQNVRRELLGLDTGDDLARQAADAIRKSTRKYLSDMQAAGADVHIEANYFLRLWDLALIEADELGFRAFIREAVDLEIHPDPDIVADRIIENLRTGNTVRPEQTRITMGREVFFKNAQYEELMHQRFSSVSVLEAISASLDRIAQNSVLVEQFGPRPYSTILQLTDLATREVRAAGGVAQKTILKRQENIRRNLDVISDAISRPVDQTLASIGHGARLAMMGLTLGGVAKWAILDAATSAWNISGAGGRRTFSRFFNDYFHQFSDAFSAFSKNPTLAKQVADDWGIFLGMMSHATISRWNPNSFAGLSAGAGHVGRVAARFERTSAKFANSVMRLGGAQHLTVGIKTAQVVGQLRALARHTDFDLDTLGRQSPSLKARLEEVGINSQMWDRIRRSEHMENGLLSRQRMRDEEAQLAIHAYLLREADIAIPTANLTATSILKSGFRAGTWRGELQQSALQFQQFGLSLVLNAVARSIREDGLTGFAGLALPLFVGGMLKSQLDAITSGRPTYDWDSPLLYTDAMDKSGLFWFAGAMAANSAHKIAAGRDVSLFELLGDNFGPVVGFTADAVETTFEGLSLLQDDQRLTPGMKEQWLRRSLSLIPYRNLWYYYAGITKVQDYLYDEVNPAYSTKLRRRLRDQGRSGDAWIDRLLGQ